MKNFSVCPLEGIAKLQGEMTFIERLESKVRTDIQSGELAHIELLESFDSK